MIPITCELSGDEQAVAPDPKLILWGCVASETAVSATTAEFSLFHGTSSAGQRILTPANFAADGFMYPIWFPHPVPCPDGIFIERTSGAVMLVLYVDYQ